MGSWRNCFLTAAAVVACIAVVLVVLDGDLTIHSAGPIDDKEFLPLPGGLELIADRRDCGSLECGRSFLVIGRNISQGDSTAIVVEHLATSHAWEEQRDALQAGQTTCRNDGYLCVDVAIANPRDSSRDFLYDVADLQLMGERPPGTVADVRFRSCCGDRFVPWKDALPGTSTQVITLAVTGFLTMLACRLLRRSTLDTTG